LALEQREPGGEEEAADEHGVGEDGEGGTEVEDLEDDDVRDSEDAVVGRDREHECGKDEQDNEASAPGSCSRAATVSVRPGRSGSIPRRRPPA
jgi:hypothetical protein